MNSKTVLITGASRGIGRAAALAFAREGWQIGITCRQSRNALEETACAVRALGVSCLPLTGDCGDPEDCEAIVRAFLQEYGHIDLLINNAGISRIGLLQDMTPAEWDHLLRSNLSSVFYMSRPVISAMLPRKQGKIINISSVWGIVGASCEAAYSASKGGINALTRALGKELAPSNIQVLALACGAIDTSMNHCFSAEELRELEEEIPAGRLGRPEEVGDLLCRLACAPAYLTGQVITLDGGWI